MKYLLLCCSFLFLSAAYSQSADFLVLKKKNKIIQKFFSGENIAFTSSNGNHLDAYINKIQNDTVYLQQFVVRYLPTTFGTYIVDTAGSYRYKYHYKQIVAIGQKANSNFNWKGSGAALLSGGAVLTLGSGVVAIADPKKFSAPLLIGSAALGTLGYFMAKGKKSLGLPIGKKYTLTYMNMQNKPS